MQEKIIVIGNGAAGISALEEIIKQGDAYDVTVISSEKVPAYFRPMLSEYISDVEVPKRFYLHDLSWYKDHNIKLHLNTEVLAIEPTDQVIKLSDGATLPYDKLLLCTGSKNFIPPMPGSKKENVFDLRTYEDANIIKEKAKDAKSAVIIGGGLLGLELGWQLRKLNIEVSVIEMMQRLLPRQLDEEASVLFEESVKATGIKVIKGVQTQEIVGEPKAEGVMLTTGEVIKGDLIIFSIGIRADVQLAKNAGLTTDRGIIVNDFMQTSVKNIYAAGDCAEYSGINYAIWPEAVEQGKVAGLNAIGSKTVYEPVVPFNIYHGMNLRLFSMGDVGGNPANQYEVHRVGEIEHFEKYYYVNDHLVGGILMGNISKSGKLKKGIISRMTRAEFEME